MIDGNPYKNLVRKPGKTDYSVGVPPLLPRRDSTTLSSLEKPDHECVPDPKSTREEGKS
jgi:hypothetical protein